MLIILDLAPKKNSSAAEACQEWTRTCGATMSDLRAERLLNRAFAGHGNLPASFRAEGETALFEVSQRDYLHDGG